MVPFIFLFQTSCLLQSCYLQTAVINPSATNLLFKSTWSASAGLLHPEFFRAGAPPMAAISPDLRQIRDETSFSMLR